MIYLLVGIAGVIGAVLRYLIGLTLFNESTLFPFATLLINLIGSFLLAWLTTSIFARTSMNSALKTAIGTGLIGSFTTFSTFSVETVKLFERGHLLLAIIYVLVSMIGGLTMSRLGVRVHKEEQKG